jgi:putative copper resistance protein D
MLPAWPLDPAVVAALLVAGWVYVRADRRVRLHRQGILPRTRPWWFVCGLIVTFAALQGPLDAHAATSFFPHMIQHLLLTMVAAPLLVLGAPISLALLASNPRTRKRLVSALRSRPVHVLGNPILGWTLFVVVLYATHFSGIYELALRNAGVHALEHLAYLATAVLFWIPVVGVDPSRSGLSHPARVLYLFLAIFVAGMIFFCAQFLRTENRIDYVRNVFVFAFLTYPFLFNIDRSNFECLLFVHQALFIYFYTRKKYLLSSIFLSFAVAMKAYPVIFLLLFIADKKFKEAFKYKKANISLIENNQSTTTHPQAIYTSRLLNPYTTGLIKIDWSESKNDQ